VNYYLFGALLPLVIIFAACGGNSLHEGEGVAAAQNIESYEEVKLELELPASVRVAEVVPITLRVRNNGPDPLHLSLTGRPTAFDLVVKTADGREVWRRLYGVAIPMILQIAILHPDGVLEFTDTWDQQDNEGKGVRPGRYYVHGVLPTDDGDLRTEVRELVIEGR